MTSQRGAKQLTEKHFVIECLDDDHGFAGGERSQLVFFARLQAVHGDASAFRRHPQRLRRENVSGRVAGGDVIDGIAGRTGHHLHGGDLALGQRNDFGDAGFVATQGDDIDLRGKLVATPDKELRDAW